MKRTDKKAFTMYELVIVIVVIAILAAILIPTFASLIEKSRVASDSNMIASVNLALEDDEESYGKPDTMYDALMIALDVGYKLETYEPVSKGKIVYDSENNRFALINEKETKLLFGDDKTKEIVKASEGNGDYRLWRIVKGDAEPEETVTELLKKYSVYLASDVTGVTDLTLNGFGFDAGDNTSAINITCSYSDDRTVVIRTNSYDKDGSVLTVNAPQGTVKHYGIIGTLTIEAVATESYHEFGYVGEFKQMTSGHFIAENGARFHQTRAQVQAVVGSNKYTERSGVIYGAHYYDAEGNCVYKDDNEKEPEQTHTHNFVVVEGGVDATCTTAGYHILKCECGMEKVGEMISALGHDWIEQDRVEATKDAEGKITYKCSRCEDTKEVSIPKLDHMHVLDHYDAKTATCIATGNVEYWKCSECGGTYSDEKAQNRLVDPTKPVDANAHLWGEIKYIWSYDYSTCTAVRVCQHSQDHKEFEIAPSQKIVTQEASCTLDQISTFTANFTNSAFATQTVSGIKTADKIGHKVDEWTSVDDSTHKGTCTSCQETITEEHIFVGNSNTCSECNFTRSTGGSSSTPSVEADGLRADGFYYVNGERYTGKTDNGYEYIDGRLVVSAKDTDDAFVYDLPDDADYVTKEIVLNASDTLDIFMEYALPGGGSYAGSAVTIPNAYSLKSIATTGYTIYAYEHDKNGNIAEDSEENAIITGQYSFDLDAVIEYLYEAIYGDAIKEGEIEEGKTKKDVILQTLAEKYHFTEDHYPNYTKSNDYEAYKKSSEYPSISFGKFLRNKYEIDGILQLSWESKVNYYDGWYCWPSSNNSNNAVGIINGSVVRENDKNVKCDDPEIILLFLKHTYENALFMGASVEVKNVNNILNDIATPSSKFYQFDGEDWMSKVSDSYGVELYSLYDLQDGMDVTKINNAMSASCTNTFYVFTASHGFAFGNIHQGTDFAAPKYEIIAENPTWSLN